MQGLARGEIDRIRDLRRRGYSFPEIQRKVRRGAGTVYRYGCSVQVDTQYAEVLKVKQGGSKERSRKSWEIARERAKKIIGHLSARDKILILAGLYWGEGTKRELNIINGDAHLLGVFVECLYSLGVPKESLVFSLRVFHDIDEARAIRYWSRIFAVPESRIKIGEVVEGKKRGKLLFGMCRIRMKKSANYFKLIMSVIESLRVHLSPRSSMDRTAAS